MTLRWPPRRGIRIWEWLVAVSAVGLLLGLMNPGSNDPRQRRGHDFPPALSGQATDPEIKDWAGEYYLGDGLGHNGHLSLLDDGRFSFYVSGCGGVYGRNQGYATVRDGFLTLATLQPNGPDGRRDLPTCFLPVKWGARRYLIPPEEALDFCDGVNQGHEPRTDIHGDFYLGLGDESKPAAGPPALPEPWKGYLLPRDLDGKVVEVSPDGRAKIDLGAKDGLRPGMELFVAGYTGITITSLDSDSAWVAYSDAETSREGLTVGARVASRFGIED